MGRFAKPLQGLKLLLGFESPLSATAHFANKNAAICSMLPFFLMCHLFGITVSVISDGSSKFGHADRRRMP